MERGSGCHAAWHAGQIVSATWWHPGDAWIEDLERRFLLGPGEVYFYDAWTVPRLRGRNITPARSALTLRALREQGFVRAIAFLLPENRPVHKAVEKVGWRRFGTAGFVRIGPARIEFVRALGRTRWRTRRRRAEAAPGEPPRAESGSSLSRVEPELRHAARADRSRSPKVRAAKAD